MLLPLLRNGFLNQHLAVKQHIIRHHHANSQVYFYDYSEVKVHGPD